jgi:hypothetical protein
MMQEKIESVLDRVKDPASDLSVAQLGLAKKEVSPGGMCPLGFQFKLTHFLGDPWPARAAAGNKYIEDVVDFLCHWVGDQG